jgi:haloacid dehalogenase-like hydrolase
MWWMLEKARQKGVTVTKELLRRHGAATPLYDGLDTWFDRINAYCAERGQTLEHYVVSSGNHELIEGCPIFPRFKRVFASQFIYDDAGAAIWPGVAINYTTKTQYLFRINKGVTNSWDDAAVNRWQPLDERPVPFTRMIFIGDGDTDIPSMKMVRHQGGYSIAVFDEREWREARSKEKLHRLIAEDRAHFVAPADYREGSQLDVIVRGVLGRFAIADGYRGSDG